MEPFRSCGVSYSSLFPQRGVEYKGLHNQCLVKVAIAQIISIAYRQDTSKRDGAQSVNQLASHEVIQKPPIPRPTPKKGGGGHIKRV